MSDESEASVALSRDEQFEQLHPILTAVLKVSVAVGAVLAALTAAVFFLIYVPMRDHQAAVLRQQQAQLAAQAVRDTQARQAKERADQVASVKSALDTCLTAASTDYVTNWSHACEARGMHAGCALPSYETDAITTTRENAKARCVELAKYTLAPPA